MGRQLGRKHRFCNLSPSDDEIPKSDGDMSWEDPDHQFKGQTSKNLKSTTPPNKFKPPTNRIANGMPNSNPIIAPDFEMIFGSTEEAYALWRLYALRTGFSTQKRTRHTIDDIPYRATFICSRGRKKKITATPKYQAED